MTQKRRVALAVVATLLVLGTIVGYGVARLTDWHRRGTAGVAYFPGMPPGAKKKAPPPILKNLGFEPGAVFMVIPTAPGDRAGVHAADFVVSINGIPIEQKDKLVELDRRLRTGDTVTYQLRRGDKQVRATARLISPLRITFSLLALTVYAVVALTFMVIGLVVFLRNPNDRRVVVFYAVTIVGAASLLAAQALALDASNMRGISSDQSGRNMIPMVAMMTTIVAFLPLTLHLALIFPRERPIVLRSPQVLRFVYGFPAAAVLAVALFGAIAVIAGQGREAAKALNTPLNVLFGAVTLAGMVVALLIARRGREEGTWRAFWNRPLQSVFVVIACLFALIRVADAINVTAVEVLAGILVIVGPVLLLFIGYPVLSCVSLYRSYRDAGAEERRQVKWPLWGTIIAIAGRILISVIMQFVGFGLLMMGRDTRTWLMLAQFADVLATLLYVLIPISFAIAILKYRLMNIDIIIKKTVVYAMLSGAIIFVYLLLVGGLGTMLVNVAGVRNQTMVIASTLVVALLFVPLRNKVQTLVERNMFRHKFDYPAALTAIRAETPTATDLGTLLASAAEKTQQALQNRAVVIFVSRHEEFVAAAKVGVADSLIGTLRVPRASVLGNLTRPFDPRRHALSEDATGALKRIEASLIVPINTPGTAPNGFIALAPKLSGGEFDVEDIDFLRAVAEQLDIGIDRVRLLREEQDYEQARDIQQRLLPREMPRIEGLDLSGTWQSARTMGGDYYDVLKLGETELAVCIGDVAGKGMPAALLMSGLQAAVRASASNSPRDLCERVRRVVVSSLSGGRFVTFFYATIDAAAMMLRWTNAGHNAPILVRAGGTIVRLADGGPAISRLFQQPYEEREIALLPGDRIILFTDGVSEASNSAGEQFGEERIEQIALSSPTSSADQLLQTIARASTTFAGGQVEDDLTLVVIRVA